MKTQTRYDLRIISPEIFFSEEQRPSIHVIGSSKQGKSRFIEWLMREDIRRGIGCCLLDPTSSGETARRLLAYCCEQGIKNVLYINLKHAYTPYKKLLGLQPFKYQRGEPTQELREASVNTLMNTIRSLYNVKDPSNQSFIERYLPAVFYTLYDNKKPLSAVQLFTTHEHMPEVRELIANTDSASEDQIREVLRYPRSFNDFQSSINRMFRFVRGRVGLMFTPELGVDWVKAVRNHYVIIARLDNIDRFDARLLGTYIITELERAKEYLNELIDALPDTNKHGKYPPYYLYADEAYMFASLALKDMLDMRQKMNFKLTLAHHTASQFEDPAVYDSIKTNCDMTVAFYVKSRKDRDEIAGEMYGGDIDPKDASYANSNIPKQMAVIKFGKDLPVRTPIPHVPPPNVSPDEVREYLVGLYANNWYYDTEQLVQQSPAYESQQAGDDRDNSAVRAKNDRRTNRQNTQPKSSDNSQAWEVLPNDLPGRKRPAPADDPPQSETS